MRHSILLSAVLLTLPLAACGSTSIDAEKGESRIKEEIEQVTSQTGTTVECPEDVDAKKGATFKCTAKGKDGTSLPVDVRQTDDDGNVRFGAKLLKTSEAERLIGAKFAESGAAVKVDCPDLVALKAGGKFACKARSGKDSVTVDAVFTDANGAFRYQARTS